MFTPPLDICEAEEEVVLYADMPGVPIEGVEIDLDGDQFTIRVRVPARNEAGGKVLLSEQREGDCFRQFNLSEAIDRDKIQASMKDDVLEVVLPKTEVARPRRIEVKTL
jgi:HSP20 family molecular chaperone IbpA